MNAPLFFRALALGFLLILPAAAAGEGWETDIDKALKLAKKQNKAVMVEFTGSDWCPPCIMMNKQVFSKNEFVSKASEKFVLVEIDVPQGDKALREKNEPVAEKYAIEGFPSVVLLDSSGKEFYRFFPTEHPTIEKLLAHLDDALEKKNMD